MKCISVHCFWSEFWNHLYESVLSTTGCLVHRILKFRLNMYSVLTHATPLIAVALAMSLVGEIEFAVVGLVSNVASNWAILRLSLSWQTQIWRWTSDQNIRGVLKVHIWSQTCAAAIYVCIYIYTYILSLVCLSRLAQAALESAMIYSLWVRVFAMQLLSNYQHGPITMRLAASSSCCHYTSLSKIAKHLVYVL